MKPIEYPALTPYAERYAEVPGASLEVRLSLRPGGRIAAYDPPNLDNILAWAVVMEATGGAGPPHEAQGGYLLPLPLRALWRDPEGYPLWAVTPLAPEGMSVEDVAILHKRAQSGEWTGTKSGKLRLNTSAGRWMERRIPQPVIICDEWICRCQGDAEEIARLLQSVAWVGKRRHAGFGEVERWRVAPAPAFSLVEGGRLTRSVPVGAAELLPRMPGTPPSPAVAWACPQWKPSLWRPGWRVGEVA